MTMMMSENHNGHWSVWQQVSTEEPFIRTHHLQSDLITQNSSHRILGRGGGLVLTSYHLWGGREERGGGRKGGEETEDHPRISKIAGKGQTIHPWSDRASNYFVSGEDDIKPRSIPAIQTDQPKIQHRCCSRCPTVPALAGFVFLCMNINIREYMSIHDVHSNLFPPYIYFPPACQRTDPREMAGPLIFGQPYIKTRNSHRTYIHTVCKYVHNVGISVVKKERRNLFSVQVHSFVTIALGSTVGYVRALPRNTCIGLPPFQEFLSVWI